MSEDKTHVSNDCKNIHEIRNQDLVSRLLAATPPYLYSAPIGQNSFFFSDMLRSLVQARNNESSRSIQMQQAMLGKRTRKRNWVNNRSYLDNLKDIKVTDDKYQTERPLQLSNKQIFQNSQKYAKIEQKDENLSTNQSQINKNKSYTEFSGQSQNHVTGTITDPSSVAQLSQSELVLPTPPPPVWYPSIYPPYGIDPLHFFIDLRVSGHIYDRKKDNPSPLDETDNNNVTNNELDNIGKQRLGSAFTVPPPRNETKNSNQVNLNNFEKFYENINESKENELNSRNANYVFQNLPKIYNNLTTNDSDENSPENDCKSIPEVEDTDIYSEKSTTDHIDVEIVDSTKIKHNQHRQNINE